MVAMFFLRFALFRARVLAASMAIEEPGGDRWRTPLAGP